MKPTATRTNSRRAFQALGTDRSRLANELDGSLVRSRQLERVSHDLAQRLDTAIGTIREVLDNGEAT